MPKITFNENQTPIRSAKRIDKPGGLIGLVMRLPFVNTKQEATRFLVMVLVVCIIAIAVLNWPSGSGTDNIPPEAFRDQILDE